ncbi:MAG: hypothetical protein OYH77_00210, partial [Pseudomonadota bacterium]|nr:hypothetical protein [Pseudomonadota bacterium]
MFTNICWFGSEQTFYHSYDSWQNSFSDSDKYQHLVITPIGDSWIVVRQMLVSSESEKNIYETNSIEMRQ